MAVPVPLFSYILGRTWWANIPKGEWPTGAAALIKRDWDDAEGGFGDRRQVSALRRAFLVAHWKSSFPF